MTKKPPFRVVDCVVTTYHRSAQDVPRKVTQVTAARQYESGWAVSADGGVSCLTCHQVPSSPIQNVDSGWFHVAPGAP